jgi:hypothetical protein
MRRAFLIVVVLSAALPGAARASFSPPQEAAPTGRFHRGFLAAADATGRLTVATRSAFDVPRLIERPAAGAAWADLPPVAGIAPRSLVSSSSMAAAGNGALAVAWIVSHRFDFSLLVAVRPPGGALAQPVVLAAPQAGGVDHPSVAVNAVGDVLVAYQTATKASHLRLQGRIAVAYRPAGRSAFVGPVVVDRVLGTPPTVALAADGTGMVAWSRHRTLKAVTVRPGGAIGRAEAILRPKNGRAVVAVGPRSAATVAYAVTDTAIHGRRVSHHMRVRVVSRTPGGTFGRPRLVFESRNAGRDLTIAADEQGRATLAWTDVRIVGRGVGPGRLFAVAGRVGGRFGRPRVIAAREDPADVLSIAARDGHVALSWAAAARLRPTGVLAATGDWDQPLAVDRVPSGPPVGPTTVALAADGHATVLWRAGSIWASDGP